MGLNRKGKFWPEVRALIWEKAQQLYQQDQSAAAEDNFTGTTATRLELMEGGYFNDAKVVVLRDLRLQKENSKAGK